MTRPAVLSTIPRSGTWHAKYFFRVYSELLKGNVNPDVLKLHPVVATPGDNDYLGAHGLAPLIIDHYHCIGFERLDLPAMEQWKELTRSLGSYAFFKDVSSILHYCDPQVTPESRLCLIARNPLEVCISVARLKPAKGPRPIPPLRKQILRRFLPKKKETTPRIDNPQWPIVQTPNPFGPKRFDDVVGNFRHSRLMEAYVVYLLSYVWMQRLFPQQVLIVPYEDIRHDPYGAYMRIIRHFDLAGAAGGRCEAYVRKALALTAYEKMQEYEAILGQSLSSPPARDGSEKHRFHNTKHLPTMKHKPWQELFTKEDFRHVIEVLSRYSLEPEHIGPKFAAELRALAA